MKYLNTAILFIALVFQASLSFAAGHVQVHDAWIPEAPPVADVMAAYMTIENSGTKPVTITGVSCDAFGMVMMHKTVTENGVSRMIHLGSLTVAPKSKAVFERGGMHVMLMGPKHSFKVGDKVKLTLTTKDNQHIDFTAVVKPATLGDDHQH
jgi:copper(I)-binding protein